MTTQPNNASVVFALQYNPVTKIADFYKSLDSGATFIHKPTGWFQVPSADSLLIQSYGGCIATTEADSNRIYVLLVGSSQAAAQLQLNGQIGIYRSDDGGETWSHPHGLIGAPYDAATHPNMMTFSGGTSTYNQIYYNTTLVASQLDPDKILIGGMSMWKSTDAAATYQPVGGYIGNVPFVHPDNQEFKIYKTSPVTEEIWFANDGGINYSTDFVNTHESRCNGLYGTAMWGFDQGWNDDILCGGRYHNGNSARRDGYPEGSFQQLGGGEAPTGYVNYSDEKKTYYSDIGGKVLPDTLNGITTSFPVGEDPNESYWDNNSSRIMFDWDYWNVAYLGKDNQILKSTNGGSSFGSLYTFGSVAGDRILWIEQSRANTQVICAQQVVSNLSTIWKSADRGISWSQISLPQNKRELCFTLSAVNADELWICYPGGSNGQKVYHSINSGTNWTNLTTPTLDGMETEAIAHQFGTDGGIYIGTHYGPVFYRNDSLTDWQVLGTNLPFISYPLRLVPFYRENKIRLATWHLGILENDLYEPSEVMADFSANYEAFYCPGDTIRFVPHSVASAGATYQWTFPGATPSSSTQMYPEVVYTSSGNFDVSLVVSDNGSGDSITKTNFIKTIPGGVLPLSEGFESGQIAGDWKLEGTGSVASNWTITSTAGGFGASTNSLLYDNFAYDIQGAHDALWTAKYDFSNFQNAYLNFDVAYAPYGGQYMDTLEVLASIDCGVTFTSLYLKGGNTLATAPQFQSSIFIPDPTQWRTDTIDVSWLAGNNEVLFSFTNIGRWGQAIYVDNINLSTVFTQLSEPENSFSFDVIPNPSTSEISISFPVMSKDLVLHIFSLDGRLVYSAKISDNKKISIEFLADGAYYVVLEASDQRAVRKFFKAN